MEVREEMQVRVEQEVDPEVQPDIERFENDALYFDRHRDELLREYPERWVAIYNQEVVGMAKTPQRLLAQLKRKGIPPGRSYWGHLSTKEGLWILASPAS